MCQWKSGIAVRVSETDIEVRTLLGKDSHSEIRASHNIPEDNGGMVGRGQTPIEFIPARGFKEQDFDLVFDAGKPEWWTDGMTEQAKSQMWLAVNADMKTGNVEKLQLTLTCGVELAWLKTGNVDARSAKTVNLPQHTTGNVNANFAKTVSLPKHTTGNVNASSAKTVNLPKHTTGYVDASSAKTVNLPKHTTGYVYASSAKTVSLPKHTTGDVDAPNAKIVKVS